MRFDVRLVAVVLSLMAIEAQRAQSQDLGFWTPEGEYLFLSPGIGSTLSGEYFSIEAGSPISIAEVEGTQSQDRIDLQIKLPSGYTDLKFQRSKNIDGNTYWENTAPTCPSCGTALASGLFGITNRSDPAADELLKTWNGAPDNTASLDSINALLAAFPELRSELNSPAGLLVPRYEAALASAYAASLGNKSSSGDPLISIRTLGESSYGDKALVVLSSITSDGQDQISYLRLLDNGAQNAVRSFVFREPEPFFEVAVKSPSYLDLISDIARDAAESTLDMQDRLSGAIGSSACSVELFVVGLSLKGNAFCKYHSSQVGVGGSYWLLTKLSFTVYRLASAADTLVIACYYKSTWDSGAPSTPPNDQKFQEMERDSTQASGELAFINRVKVALKENIKP